MINFLRELTYGNLILIVLAIVAIPFAVLITRVSIRNAKKERERHREAARRHAQEEAERKQWLAGALVNYKRAIAARDERERAQAQRAPLHSPAPAEQNPWATVPIPRPAPTVRPPTPSRPLPKHSAIRNAPSRHPAPPGPAPAPWQIEGLHGFRNLRIIGRGGFADVLYGEDSTGLPQAIKVLRTTGVEIS